MKGAPQCPRLVAHGHGMLLHMPRNLNTLIRTYLIIILLLSGHSCFLPKVAAQAAADHTLSKRRRL